MKKRLHFARRTSIKMCSLMMLLILLTCHARQRERNTQQKKEIWVTVFVHGIMSIQPHLNPNNLAKVISNKVENSIYYDAVVHMRKDPFFFKNQAMQGIGLHPINQNSITAGNASGAIARLFSISIEQTGLPTQDDRYYTFGWYGVISPKVRLKAGMQLCCELAKEIRRLRTEGFEPRIRVIGYSHGGNVALNMAIVASKYTDSLPCIDELVLMGIPIQPENDHLINSPFFKEVYNLFSKGDYIQPLDCFSSRCFFSKRRFVSRKNFTVPKKVTQIQIKITKSMACTKDNIYCDSDVTVKGNARFQRDRSPGHVELWFFGWTPKHYRNTFLLYPLPILAIVPQIIYYTKRYAQEQNICQEDVIVADLRPDDALMIIRKAKSPKLFAFVPFLSNADINALANRIKAYKPHTFTKKMYDEHTSNAIARAKQEKCNAPLS